MTIYPQNYQLRQFTPQTIKAMTMYPQFLKNVEITLTKIKTKVLKFNLIFKFEGYFLFYRKFYRGNFVILLALWGTLSLFC
jgi:hypothetical protein